MVKRISLLFVILLGCSAESSDEDVQVEEDTDKMVVPTIKLNSGYEMPMLGLGTYRLRKQTKVVVLEALNIGYRLIDTAGSYMATDKISSEEAIGEVIKKSSIPRKDLFIVTKITPEYFDKSGVADSVQISLEALKVEYIDLMLMHYPDCEGDPYCKMADTLENAWGYLEEAVDKKQIRSLGLSNCFETHINQIQAVAKKPISVVQNWMDPYYQDGEINAICRDKGIVYMGYSMLGAGWTDDGMDYNPILVDPTLTLIAEKHDCDVSEVVLKWAVESGIVVVPGTKQIMHLKQNFNSLKIKLDDDEIQSIYKLDGKMKPLNGPQPGGGEGAMQYSDEQFTYFGFIYGFIDVLLSYVGLGLPGVNREEL